MNINVNNKKRLFLIDGMSIIYRAHFALIKNPLITRDGRHTSAIFGFINSIFKIIKDENPDYLAVVLDSKTKTFRHDLFTEYKANRAKMPEELSQQLSPLYEIIDQMNIPLISLDGYEADDLIGTIVQKAELNDFDTYIVTGDKDMMQLVSDKTFVYSPGNRFKPTTTYNPERVKDRWGIYPDKTIDYLAMVGDSSDNITGIDGIGAKSAVKLLDTYGTLEKILEKGHETSNKRIAKGISNAKDLAHLSKKLVTIDCYVPYEFHLETFIFKSMNIDSLVEIFQDLELSSLVGKILSISNESNFDDTYKNKKYNLVDTLNRLEEMINDFKSASIVSFDVIAKGFDYKSGVIEGISFTISKDSGYYIPFNFSLENEKIFLNLLISIFNNDNYYFCSQNIKQHLVLLSKYGISFKGEFYDIILAEHLLNPEKHSYNLEFISLDYCNANIRFSDNFFKLKKDCKTLFDLDDKDQLSYSCERSDIVFQAYSIQREKLISENLFDYYQKIEQPLVRVLSDVEIEGVYVDEEILSRLSKESESKINAIKEQIFSVSGYEFNINSPRQLAILLFDDLNLRQVKKRSTAVEVLKVLKNHHPIADLILNYRRLSKLKNTYLDAFPKYINRETNRIHTSFNQTTTITGRLSSSNPNFQNIPIRTDYGKEIRKAFCGESSNKKIISADYSQIELRIMAEFSQEPNLIDAFNNDVDIHTRTASLINNIPESDVSDNQRRAAKVVNFGIMYGAGPFRRSQE